MTGVDIGFAIGLVVALGISAGHKRAWIWLFAGTASYLASVIYWRLNLPMPPFFAGFCDILVCLAVYFAGKAKWEMGVWRIFQAMVAVNGYYLGVIMGVAPSWLPSLSHNAYSIILEGLNWLALAWIAGNGLAQHVGATNGTAASRGYLAGLLRAVRTLQRERRDHPFHKVSR